MVVASGSKLLGSRLGGKAAATKLTSQKAMSKKAATAAKPKPAVKPETPQRPWEDINTIFDNKTDQFKPLSAKKSEKLRRKAGGSPQTIPVSAKPGFLSNGLVQTIGGTVVGSLGVMGLTSMFSGGGAEAAAAPAEAAPAAASSYDPYASSGSYGIPGSLPNYI